MSGEDQKGASAAADTIENGHQLTAVHADIGGDAGGTQAGGDGLRVYRVGIEQNDGLVPQHIHGDERFAGIAVGSGNAVYGTVLHHDMAVVFVQVVEIKIRHGDIQLVRIQQGSGAQRTIFQELNLDVVLLLEEVRHTGKENRADQRRNADAERVPVFIDVGKIRVQLLCLAQNAFCSLVEGFAVLCQ